VSAPVARKSRDIELAFTKYSRWWYMNRQPKLTLEFTVMSPGADFGSAIAAHYRLDHFDSRKRCYAPKRSRIVRDLGRLFPDYTGKMPLPITRLKGCTLIGRTRWISKDGKNVPIPNQQHYEIVEYLLERTNGL